MGRVQAGNQPVAAAAGCVRGLKWRALGYAAAVDAAFGRCYGCGVRHYRLYATPTCTVRGAPG